MNLIKLFFLLYTIVSFSQLDTIRGNITNVDFTKPDGIHLTITNLSNGEIIDVKTEKYIRLQKLFWIQNGESLLPPPLHITNVWTEDNVIWITVSEPVQEITLWLREHRWDGFETSGHDTTEHDYWRWASQTMINSQGEVDLHTYGIPREFLGINWSWDLIVGAKNSRGDYVESELITFKTNGKMFKY